MNAHHLSFPPAHRLSLAACVPDATWPQTILDLYRAAYALQRAAQALWQLADLAGWRDEALTRAYRATFDALDKVELIAAPELRAWEVSHR